MTDTQWGPPLTGEQMKALRDAGLDGRYRAVTASTEITSPVCAGDFNIRADFFLPYDHAAYTLLKAGWLDGRNVRLWFGGDKAPDDWLKTPNSVLFRCGDVSLMAADWEWEHFSGEGDIIAYIAKAEDCAGCGGLNIACPDGCFDEQPETVTIATMTEAGARKRFDGHFHYIEVLQTLGLIKPEPTRAERFWKGKERHSLYRDESARALIDAALEFER